MSPSALSPTPSAPVPLDLTHPSLYLSYLPDTYTLLKLPLVQAIPPEILSALTSTGSTSRFISLTRTSSSYTLICPTSLLSRRDSHLPHQHEEIASASTTSTSYKLLRLSGPLPLHLTGILSTLIHPLKEVGIPIFVMSSWETDWVLIEEERAGECRMVLEGEGWRWI